MSVDRCFALILLACSLGIGSLNAAVAAACDAPQFAATGGYPMGGVGFSMVSGDFNRDGKPDVAVAVLQGTNTVLVFLGRGDGTLEAPLKYTPVAFPRSIQFADMNGDGTDDLLVNDTVTLWVLSGNGNGTFQNGVEVPGLGGPFVATGRFNSDTIPDLVIAQSIFLRVRNSNPDGTFKADGTFTIDTQESPVSVATGDMNGDGSDDIVAGTAGTSHGSIAVLLGRGDGVFIPAPATPAGTNNSLVLLGDLNRDGRKDVVVGDYAGSVTTYLGRGDGTLRYNSVYSVGAQLTGMSLADFDGDGTNDLAVATGKAVSILLGREGGDFIPAPIHDGLWLSVAVAAADFNADGKADLASNVESGSQRLGITFGRGDGTFAVAAHYPVGLNPQSVALGDLNGDRLPDMAVANLGSDNVSVLLNRGDGAFQPTANYTTPQAPQGLAIADLDRDGINDIFVTTVTGTNQLSVLRGNGDGTFQAATRYGMFGGGPIGVGDFNGDGRLDALANSLLGGMQVQLGNGSGGFAPGPGGPGLNAFGAGPATLAIGDLNSDTRLDFVLADSFGGTVGVCLGKGDGSFQPPVSYAAGTNAQSVVLTEVNSDGKADLVVANSGSFLGDDGSVAVLLGAGDGTFEPATHYLAGADPLFVTAGDVNGDGKIDLTVRGQLGFGMAVLLGTGDGTFGRPAYFSSRNDAVIPAMAMADLNDDGRLDAVLLNLESTVAVMLNRCGASGPSVASLGINLSGDSIVLRWPVSATDARIQSTARLSPIEWEGVTQTPTANNEWLEVRLPLSGGTRFFRLEIGR